VTSTPTRPVDNVDRNINILDGTTVENKGKLILTKIKLGLHPLKACLARLQAK